MALSCDTKETFAGFVVLHGEEYSFNLDDDRGRAGPVQLRHRLVSQSNQRPDPTQRRRFREVVTQCPAASSHVFDVIARNSPFTTTGLDRRHRGVRGSGFFQQTPGNQALRSNLLGCSRVAPGAAEAVPPASEVAKSAAAPIPPARRIDALSSGVLRFSIVFPSGVACSRQAPARIRVQYPRSYAGGIAATPSTVGQVTARGRACHVLDRSQREAAGVDTWFHVAQLPVRRRPPSVGSRGQGGATPSRSGPPAGHVKVGRRLRQNPPLAAQFWSPRPPGSQRELRRPGHLGDEAVHPASSPVRGSLLRDHVSPCIGRARRIIGFRLRGPRRPIRINYDRLRST